VNGCLRAGGETCEVAFAQCALGLMGYMTDPDKVEIDASCERVVEASGHDALSLLYNFLNEVLSVFTEDYVIMRECVVEELVFSVPLDRPVTAGDGADDEEGAGAAGSSGAAPREAGGSCRVRARLRGEAFDLAKHPQGTEVKAITYSNMQILPPQPESEGDGGEGVEEGGEDGDGAPSGAPVPLCWNIYAIIDI
jgi:SHS2 domain-containing protein